ncbi:hypothetical protein INT48_005174, partial [Thamnidium elegans]
PSDINPNVVLTEESNRLYGLHNYVSRLPKIQQDIIAKETTEERDVREERRESIKQSFLYGWNGYKTYALGADELKPLSNKSNNPFGGLGATLVDSIGTMLIMELDIDELLPLIQKIKVKPDEQMSVFETIIRYLGGLLSAFELSDHPRKHILLDKAEEIGLALLPAFETAFGLPYYHFNPLTKVSKTNTTYLADAATIQLEFITLSYHTGNPIFAEKAQVIMDFIDSADYSQGVTVPGLYPSDINIADGYFKNSVISFGAMGDSAYEYFLKQYLLVDGTVPQFGRMYEQSIDSMKSHMLVQLPGAKFLYLTPYDADRKLKTNAMDHLTCFVPGMLAIGSKIFNRPDDMKVAKGLLETCVHMYRSSNTHLSPEIWSVGKDSVPYNAMTYGKSEEELVNARSWKNWRNRHVATPPSPPPKKQEPIQKFSRVLEDVPETPDGSVIYDTRYLLRPETIESLFVMYRMTGDPVYQEYGWLIYQGIETYCKTKSAYASVKNVRLSKMDTTSNQIDSMETFLFAETFKYLYLLFSPPDLISLDKFVFNTEAHPLLRRPMDFSK